MAEITAPEAGSAASSAARPAAPERRRSPGAALRGALVPMAAIAAMAALFAVLFPGFLNYDSFYSLAWAGDIIHGRTPDFDTPFAPTPHPLQLALAILAMQFGADAAATIFLAISFLSLGAFVWLCYRLGREWFGLGVGILAAVIVATRDQIVALAVHGRVDLPFATLVLAAALVVTRRPRAGAPALVLLTLAGLLRPEAWALALIYWLWLWRGLDWRRRGLLGLLAISGPLLWALSDLAITGDALHSFSGTADLADKLEHRRSVSDLPYSLPIGLAYFAREPVMLGALVGFAFAIVHRRRQAVMGLVLLGLSFAAFAGLALAHLPLIARYLLWGVAVLCVLAALSVLGWRDLEGAARRPWKVAGLLVAAVFIFFVPIMAFRLVAVRWEAEQRGTFQHDLELLARSRGAAPYLDQPACFPVFTQNHRQVPFLRTWLDEGPSQVVNGFVRRPRGGMMVRAIDPEAEVGYVRRLNDKAVWDTPRPHDFRLVALNSTWGLYASRECVIAQVEAARASP